MAVRGSRSQDDAGTMGYSEVRTYWKAELKGAASPESGTTERRVFPELVGNELCLWDVTKTVNGEKTSYYKDDGSAPLVSILLKVEQKDERWKVLKDHPAEKEERGIRIKVLRTSSDRGADGEVQHEELCVLKTSIKSEATALWYQLEHFAAKTKGVECVDNAGFWIQFDSIKDVKPRSQAGRYFGIVPWTDKQVRIYLETETTGKLLQDDSDPEDISITIGEDGKYTFETRKYRLEGTKDESECISGVAHDTTGTKPKGKFSLKPLAQLDEEAVYYVVWAKWKLPNQAYFNMGATRLVNGQVKLRQQLLLKEDDGPAANFLAQVRIQEIPPLDKESAPVDVKALKHRKKLEWFPFGSFEFDASDEKMYERRGQAMDIVDESGENTGAKAQIRVKPPKWDAEEEDDAVVVKTSVKSASGEEALPMVSSSTFEAAPHPAIADAPTASPSPSPSSSPSPSTTTPAPAPAPAAPVTPVASRTSIPGSATAAAAARRASKKDQGPTVVDQRGSKVSETMSGRASNPGRKSDPNPQEQTPQPSRGQSPAEDSSPVPQYFSVADAMKLLQGQDNEQYRSLTTKEVSEIYRAARADKLTFEQLEEEVNAHLQRQYDAQIAAQEAYARKQAQQSGYGQARAPTRGASSPQSAARNRSPQRGPSPPRSPANSTRSGGIWSSTGAPSSPRKLLPGEVHEHSNHLYSMHKAKMEKLEKMKAEQELMEARKIQEEANQARPIRKQLQGQCFDPYELSDRLYKEHRAIKQRHEVLGRKFKEEESRSIEKGRTRQRPPEERPETDITEIVDRLTSWEERRRQKLQQELERKAIEEKSLVKYGCAEDDSQRQMALQRSQQLFDEAQERRAMIKKREEELKLKERMQISQTSIHKDEDRSVNMERIEQLHKEGEERNQRRTHQIKNEEDQAVQRIQQEKQKLKQLCDTVKTNECKNITARYEEIPKHRDPVNVKAKELAEQEELAKRKPKQMTPMNIIHHVLSTLNSALAQRCGNTPEDAPTQELSELGNLLKEAMQKFKDAGSVSDINAEGGSSLRNLKNKSLYSDGQLMDDADGWARCCAPDPIRQLHSDLESLTTVAKKAQAVLQLNFMNDIPKDMDAVEKAWPPNSVYNRPKAFPVVKYAYNPGPKSKEAINHKSTVQYGPAEGPRRFMHCLDMARVSLVCQSSAALRLTLEHVCDRFEVVHVRNHYQPHMAGLLGDKYVEVLVVLKQGLPFPMVCEIRLEEECFHDARKAAKPVLAKVAKGFSSIYMREGIAPAYLEYFVKWLLMKPKAVHALTVFRRQLSRRYSSSIVAWRQLFSGSPGTNQVHMAFNTFREVCGHHNHRARTVEFWQELDSTRSGRICIFDLDEEAVFLLVKFLGRVVALTGEPEKADGEVLFTTMAQKALVKLSRPNLMDATEFRLCCKPMGFNASEADRLFLCLDGHGGCKAQPPATINANDLEWVKNKLPRLVDIPSVILSTPDNTQPPFRQLIAWAEATKDDDMNRNDLMQEPIAKKLQRHESICMAREASEATGAISNQQRLSLAAGAMGANLEALWRSRPSGAGNEIEDGKADDSKPQKELKPGEAAAKACADKLIADKSLADAGVVDDEEAQAESEEEEEVEGEEAEEEEAEEEDASEAGEAAAEEEEEEDEDEDDGGFDDEECF